MTHREDTIHATPATPTKEWLEWLHTNCNAESLQDSSITYSAKLQLAKLPKSPTQKANCSLRHRGP